MPRIRINTIFNVALDFATAEIPRRVLAYLVDFTLMVLYYVSMKFFIYSNSGGPDDVAFRQNYIGIDLLLISLPLMLYFPVSETLMHGQTIGKKLLDIRVISLNGGEPNLSQYLVRWMFRVFEWPFFFGYTVFSGKGLFVYILFTFLLGFIVLIIITISPKNQRLGDLAAHTVVVFARQVYSVEDTLFVEVKRDNYRVEFPEVVRLSDRDINTIHNVMHRYFKDGKSEVCHKLANRVKAVLQVNTDKDDIEFLKKLLLDYNFLATQ